MINGIEGARNLLVQFIVGSEDNVKAIEAAVSNLLPSVDTKRSKIESNLSSPSDYGKDLSSDINVDDHRTTHNLHVSVQMKLFGEFLDKMNESSVEDKFCRAASDLMLCMSKYYQYEAGRQKAFCEIINNTPLNWKVQNFTTEQRHSDGTILLNNFALVNFEFKNELCGTRSCPVKQNIGYFQNFKVGDNSRSPMLLINVTGPHYMQVFGALWNGSKVCVDPMTSPVSLLYVRRDPIYGVRNVAKVLQAIDDAIPKLEEYYNTEDKKSQFGCKGPYYKVDEYQYNIYFELDWLFKAVCHNGNEYIVKFVRSSYGIDPHKLLSDNKYAPELIRCDELKGGWFAVVMEFVRGKMMTEDDKKNPDIKESLQNAIDLLHKNNYVHGDLRRQNIIIRDDGNVCIVDFDWAGVFRTAKYPMELYKADPDQWHPSVVCGGLIDPSHDLFQISRITEQNV